MNAKSKIGIGILVLILIGIGLYYWFSRDEIFIKEPVSDPVSEEYQWPENDYGKG